MTVRALYSTRSIMQIYTAPGVAHENYLSLGACNAVVIQDPNPWSENSDALQLSNVGGKTKLVDSWNSSCCSTIVNNSLAHACSSFSMFALFGSFAWALSVTSSKSCEMQSLVTIEHLVRTAPSKECETIGRVSIYRKKIKKINCASFSDQRRSKLLNRSREASGVTETYHLSLLAPRSLFRCIQTCRYRCMLRAWKCCGVAADRWSRLALDTSSLGS